MITNLNFSRKTLTAEGIDVVLVGYYGRQNFGDDVLMIAGHAIARQLAPDARIGLLGTQAPYIPKLLGEDVGFVPFGMRHNYRLIVHGGGGTFFDFSKHSAMRRVFNRVALAFGPKAFVALETAARRMTGRPRMSAHSRVGLGLGVGTYSPGSPALLNALPTLLDFDAVWLRDLGSLKNLRRIGITTQTFLGSDLAFLHETWCPPELALAQRPPRSSESRPLIGLVMRDWPARDRGKLARQLQDSVAALSRNYRLHLVSLNPDADRETIKCFPDLPHLIWQPDKMSMTNFLRELAAHDTLVTARAHGAICGACLGIPTVILGIEPKLAAVHGMLAKSSQFVAEPFSHEALSTAITQALDVSLHSVATDVHLNREASKAALSEIIAHMGRPN